MALELTKANFDTTIAEGYTLVDFWATWCGPCRMMAPIIEELAADTSLGVKVAKVNVDEEGELAMRYGIDSIPTLIVFKDGKPAKAAIGAYPKESVLQLIDMAKNE